MKISFVIIFKFNFFKYLACQAWVFQGFLQLLSFSKFPEISLDLWRGGIHAWVQKGLCDRRPGQGESCRFGYGFHLGEKTYHNLTQPPTEKSWQHLVTSNSMSLLKARQNYSTRFDGGFFHTPRIASRPHFQLFPPISTPGWTLKLMKKNQQEEKGNGVFFPEKNTKNWILRIPKLCQMEAVRIPMASAEVCKPSLAEIFGLGKQTWKFISPITLYEGKVSESWKKSWPAFRFHHLHKCCNVV